MIPNTPNSEESPAINYTVLNESPEDKLPRWTARNMAQARQLLKTESSGDWTTDILEAAKTNIQDHGHTIIGIGCPKPIGIITFEDVIDTILQKTSRDEKDYFDRKQLWGFPFPLFCCFGSRLNVSKVLRHLKTPFDSKSSLE